MVMSFMIPPSCGMRIVNNTTFSSLLNVFLLLVLFGNSVEVPVVQVARADLMAVLVSKRTSIPAGRGAYT